MNTHFRSSGLMLLSICLTIFFLAGCKKADTGTTNTGTDDPGYGCNTNTMFQAVSDAPAKLIYIPYVPQGDRWFARVQVPGSPGYIGVYCEPCGQQTQLETILAGHSIADTIPVFVSGKIKRRYENQPVWYPDGSYPGFYMLSLENIHQ